MNVRAAFLMALVASSSLSLVAMQGAAEAQEQPERYLNKYFRIKAGESVSIPSENMTIWFVDVTEDSRCPRGVQCIQAGQATALIRIEASDTPPSATLTTLPGSMLSEDSHMRGDYVFVMHSLRPYPTESMPLDPTTDQSPYVLIMMVTKPRTG
jgi:hypothetical protein